jgi:hypothetical protein
MSNPNNVVLDPERLTSDGIEAVWMDTCPGCKAEVSAIKHDFSLCSQLRNAEYRIRELERLQRELLRVLDDPISRWRRGFVALLQKTSWMGG